MLDSSKSFFLGELGLCNGNFNIFQTKKFRLHGVFWGVSIGLLIMLFPFDLGEVLSMHQNWIDKLSCLHSLKEYTD